jgi:hypothetical protein
MILDDDGAFRARCKAEKRAAANAAADLMEKDIHLQMAADRARGLAEAHNDGPDHGGTAGIRNTAWHGSRADRIWSR